MTTENLTHHQDYEKSDRNNKRIKKIIKKKKPSP